MQLTKPKTRLLLFLLLLSLVSFGTASYLGADTIAGPVSLIIPSLPQPKGEVDSEPVSVVIGNNTISGEVDSKPVSIALGNKMMVTGEVDSKPLSVAIKPANLGDPDIVGLWHMDGDWLDSSGNGLHGTPYNGATFSNSKVMGTNSSSFNGTNNYINVNSVATITNIPQSSIEAWIYPTSVGCASGSDGRTIYSENSPGGTSFILGVNCAGNVSFGVWRSNWSIVQSSSVLTVNNWYHVVGTLDSSGIHVYVNNFPSNSNSVNSPSNVTISEVGIGRVNNNGGRNYFAGLIDELTIYKRALSAEEIAQHYAAGISGDPNAPAAPVLNAVPAFAGVNSITLSGTKPANTSIWVNNKKIVATDVSTTWSGSYTNLQLGNNLLNITALDETTPLQSPVVSETVFYDNIPPVIESSTPANNSSTAKVVNTVSINLSDTNAGVDLTASTVGATVKDSSGQTINGSWNTIAPRTILFTPSSVFASDTFTVTIQATDLVGNKQQQQIVFITHDTGAPTTKALLDGTKDSAGWYSTPVTVTLSADDTTEGSGIEKIEYSLDSGTTWQTYTTSFVVDTDGKTTLQFRATDKVGNAETAKSQEIKINKTGLVGWWKTDGDWKDSSVLGNNGTAYNGATFSAIAKIGTQAGIFNGTTQYAGISDSASLNATGAISIGFWMNPTAWGDGKSAGILSKKASDSALGYVIYDDGNYGSKINLRVQGTSGGYAFFTSNANVDLGIWQHWVATYDSATLEVRWYKNGVLDKSASGITVGDMTNAMALEIGHSQTWNGFFNGLIDDVRIYNRALSATEIMEQYRNISIDVPTVDPFTSPVNTPTINLSGSKPANTSVVISNGSTSVEIAPQSDATAWAATTWSGQYTLSPGMNNLNITSKDVDGYHSQPANVSVALDVSAPTIASSDPANNGIFKTQLSTITINLQDAFSPLDLPATIVQASVKNNSGLDVSGTWTTTGTGSTGSTVFTASAPMGEGTYTATITPADSFGNHATATISFTVDMTVPAVPTIDTIVSPVNTTSKIITGGKSSDSSRVVVSSAGASAGTMSYPSATTWSTTVSGLHEGSVTVSAYSVDTAGNQSSGTASSTFTVDLTAPAKPGIDAPVTPTNKTSITLTGVKEANSYLYVNNSKTSASFGDTTWSASVNISEGTNTITVFAKDEVGNQSPGNQVTIVRDTTAPTISASTPTVNAVTGSVSSISVTLTGGTSTPDLTASLAGAVVKNAAGAVISGSWGVSGDVIVFTPTATLPAGVYTVTIYPADTLGNKGSASFSFTVDRGPPTVQNLAISPASPLKAGNATFTLTFSEAMDTTVQPAVGFGSTSITGAWNSNKTWAGSTTLTSAMGDGSYTVTVKNAKDLAGNTMADQSAGTFVLDTTAPISPTIAAVTPLTKTATQLLTGTKPADTAIVINNIVRVALNSATTWSYSYPLVEGNNTLAIVARDAAGNDSTAITPAPVITLDTTPPVFTVDVVTNPATAATQTISGKKEPGCIVKLNGTVIFDATDQNATWSTTITLVDGISNHFVFSISDAIGNTTTKTLDILYDSVPPTALGAGVLVADGSGKGTEVTLTWPAYPEPTALAYYRVYQSSAAFNSITGLTQIGTVNKGAKSYKASGLIQGTTYWFAVVPVSTSGNSDVNVISVSAVPADTQAPEEVTGLSAAAGYNATDGNTVFLSWTPSANSIGDLADQMLYVDNGQGYDAGTSLGKTTSTFIKKGLTDATLYKFKITGKDTLGHESSGSVVQAVTRLANPTGLAIVPGNAKATLTWQPVASSYVKLYNIYRIKSDSAQTDISGMSLIKSQATTTFTDMGLTNDSTYQYAVTVLNTSGAERTNVQSVVATPRADTVGPVLSGVSLAANQVITKPLAIAVSAADAESSMDRIELYIDGTSVATIQGSSLSWNWNPADTTDGNHTIKIVAYDAPGNRTESSIPVVVSLAAPPVPVITTTFGSPINQKSTTINGTTQAGATVSLRVNGVVVSSALASTSAFSFASVPLSEGDNFISAKASNRGGESAFSADVKVSVVTTAPSAPVALAAKVLAAGAIQFSWQAGANGASVGYNLYEGPVGAASLSDSGVRKTNTALISYLLKEYIPADDTPRSYMVSAVDGAGNESAASIAVTATADRLSPSASEIRFNSGGTTPADNTCGPGPLSIALTVSETLSEAPFLSLEPQSGSPLVISLHKVDDTHYEGSLTIDATSPHGAMTWKFSGKDLVGNRGNSQGTGPILDVKGPVATVTAPLSLLKTTTGLVNVNVAFDEPSTATPILSIKASDGSTATVTGLVSTDNGIHWSGTLEPSSLAEGSAQFILAGAKDRFGNSGSTIKSGAAILLYKNTPPAPVVTTGLVAKAGKGGSIALSWTKVADAQGYNVYRQGAADSSPVLVTSITTGTTVTYTDTPDSDGTYAYAVSSVGLLGSESARCDQVSAVSDRTPPPVPTGLGLTISGNGVKALWDVVTAPAEIPSAYRLYRSDNVITDIAGLAALVTVKSTPATDALPTKVKRFYAVTALDSLGNESAPATAPEITFPVAPVADLALTLVDDGKPSLSWSSGETNLQGFYIYRNGARINQTPTTSISYSDGYYAGGTITYGVSAVDANGIESPVKEVTLPVLTIALKDGTTMHRGVLETVALMASIPANAASNLTIDAVSVKIGALPESTLNGPFTVAIDAPLEIDKVAATEATAPPQEAVVVSAIMHPVPGTTVKLTKSSLAAVLGSGTALEIFNDPLVHGTTAKVRIKVNNLGSARAEFLTSENGGPTSHVTINLKDQDGNLLAQEKLDQRTGSVVNSGAYATARLEPGESFLSDPITFTVPASAPYKVSIEATIDNTYYHYQQDDQVVAPGLKQSLDATIVDVSYTAQATTDKNVYKQGESVQITGQAVSATTGQPMPSVPVRIGVSVKGFDRFFTATTDQNGAFSFAFMPAANEAGSYSVWASHPDLTDRSIQAQFSIIGLQVYPALATVQALKGQYQDIPVTLTNLGGSSLTGVTFTTTASSGITASVVNPGNDALAAGDKRTITLRIAAAANASDSGVASLYISTAEGLTGKVDSNVYLVNPLPIISTSPSYIDTGLMRGTQRIAGFTLSNTGYGTLQNARIEGPSIPWVSLTNEKNLGDIPAGQAKNVGILINPADTVAQGVYNDRLVIYSDNHIPYTYNIQVTVTSSAVGSVQFSLLDVLMKQVGGASITIQNQSVTELLYTLTTAADGTVSLTDIPEGRYSYNITSAGHKPYGGSFVITPGVWTTVPVGLEVNLVQVEWSVTPTAIQDQYQITINQTFETNVPAPVLVTEPPSITLPGMQPGQVFNGEFAVTNYGLIAVDNPHINFPTSFGDYDVEILDVMPARIGAMQKVTVPYRITRRQTVVSLVESTNPNNSVATLCSEVGGYGGGLCVSSITLFTSGTAIICPNSPQQRTTDIQSPFTIAFPVPCSVSSPGTYVPQPYYLGVCTGSNCSSSSGGGVPGGSPTPIKTANPCDCKPDGTSCPNDGDASGCNVCKGGSCTHLSKEQCQCVGKDEFASCDDNNVCTSFSGTDIGSDVCYKGKCDGKKIEDKEGVSVGMEGDYEKNTLKGIVKSLLHFVPNIDKYFSTTVSASTQSIRRCCEKTADIRSGQQVKISPKISVSTPELPAAKIPIPAFPLVAVNVFFKASADGSGTINTDDNPCKDDCSGSTQYEASVSLTAGVGLATVDGTPDKAFLGVEGSTTTGGGGEYTFKCSGEREGKMCLGKLEAEIRVLSTGWTILGFKWKFLDGFCF